MYMIMLKILMHDIVVSFTYYDEIMVCVLMSLYVMVLPYMHNVGVVDYMMRSYLICMKLSILVLWMCGVNDRLVGSLYIYLVCVRL